LTINAKSLLLGGAAMVNSHFLFVVVQFQIIGAEGTSLASSPE
jgi:hypothetical protein